MMEADKMMDKIKKLLLKADSTDSPQEAESFFVKANKLMIKFKISQANIDQLNENPNAILTNELKYGEMSLEGKWEIELMSAVSQHQGCKYTWRSYSKVFTIYGSKEDIELTKYFFEGARSIFRHLSRKAYNEQKKNALAKNADALDSMGLTTNKARLKFLERNGEISYRSVFIRSFLYGAANGLYFKLASMVEETIKEEEGGEQYGLVLTNQLERIQNHVDTHIKPKCQNNQGAFGDQGAMAKGVAAGKNHNLTLGVEGESVDNKGLLLE